MEKKKFPLIKYRGSFYPCQATYTPESGNVYYLVYTGSDLDKTVIIKPDSFTCYRGDYWNRCQAYSDSESKNYLIRHQWLIHAQAEQVIYEFPDNDQASLMLEDFDDF